MGLDITAYWPAHLPGDSADEALHDARGRELACIRCGFPEELLRSVGWRQTKIDGHGRWVSSDDLRAGIARLRGINERERTLPRNRRRDFTRQIAFLETCLAALEADGGWWVVLVVG